LCRFHYTDTYTLTMNKQVFALFFATLALTSALPSVQRHVRAGQLTKVNRSDMDLCPLCVQFTGEALNTLLNLILNGGVVGGCGTLCQALATKTGNQILGEVCNVLCDIVGVEEFVKLIEKADLDPIYFCEELKTCPIVDNGDATITSITVSPASGPQGTRMISISYTSKNGTGTGELGISIDTVDHVPLAQRFLQEPLPAGVYNKTIQLSASPDPNCDPTQGPCERWLPGDYTVNTEICNGECGSKHPHSQVYDQKSAKFTITN